MIEYDLFEQHWKDEEGRPAGGISSGRGFAISWQNGPLGGPPGHPERREPNGAFVETVLVAVKKRLQFYQGGQFACGENEMAIQYIESAIAMLNERTARRVRAGVEGTHEGE